MAEGEGSQGIGDTGQMTGGEWRAQLPQDLRTNEAFTSYKTLGDFAKAHLDTSSKVKEYEGKVKEFEGKVANSISKLPQNATQEQINAFYASLGRPESPEAYQLPKDEEILSDPRMVSWATKLFWEAGLSQAQAIKIGQSWNEFLKGAIQEEEASAKKEIEELSKNFRKEFESKEAYDRAFEISKRYWEKLTGTKFDDYCQVSGTPDLVLMKFIYENAKKTGEDFSPQGRRPSPETKAGFTYNKSPAPPAREVI